MVFKPTKRRDRALQWRLISVGVGLDKRQISAHDREEELEQLRIFHDSSGHSSVPLLEHGDELGRLQRMDRRLCMGELRSATTRNEQMRRPMNTSAPQLTS
jgi:hypothetical protein